MSVKEEEYDELDDDDDVLEDNFDPNQFFVEDELEIPTATSYSTDTLHSELCTDAHYGRFFLNLLLAMIHQGDIDLDPGYQRGLFLSKSLVRCCSLSFCCRGRVASGKAVADYSVSLPSLLHPPSCLLHLRRSRHGYCHSKMCGWKAAFDKRSEVHGWPSTYQR